MAMISQAASSPGTAGQKAKDGEEIPHQKVSGDGFTAFAFGDASDAYANHKQLYLSFYQFAADQEISFKAFITDMNQNFTAGYGEQPVFGRNDPIMTFKHTVRKMNVSFQIPAASISEAKLNLAKCNQLVKFAYPAYEKAARADTIAKPPLMRVAFANLIRDPARGASPSAKEAGVLCAVSTLNVTPSFGDEGFFDPGMAQLYPKLISVTMDMTILHERDLGWDATGNTTAGAFGFSNLGGDPFPFGLEGFTPPTPAPDAENPEEDQTGADREAQSAEMSRLERATQRLDEADAGQRHSGGARSANRNVRRARREFRQASRAARRAGYEGNGD